jgi:hypothetical protein
VNNEDTPLRGERLDPVGKWAWAIEIREETLHGVPEFVVVVDEPGRHRDVVHATGGDASRWNRGLWSQIAHSAVRKSRP